LPDVSKSELSGFLIFAFALIMDDCPNDSSGANRRFHSRLLIKTVKEPIVFPTVINEVGSFLWLLP